MGFFLADPFFLAALVARRMPGIGGMPGIPPPPIICRIILWPSWNRTTRLFTSPTLVPEPPAIRARREPLMNFEFSRSPGVIDRMIAVILSK